MLMFLKSLILIAFELKCNFKFRTICTVLDFCVLFSNWLGLTAQPGTCMRR